MPAAIPKPVREELVRRRQQGELFTDIAREVGLSYRVVRGLWRRYRQHGEQGLDNDYARCGRSGPRFDKQTYQAALALKREHPRWGRWVDPLAARGRQSRAGHTQRAHVESLDPGGRPPALTRSSPQDQSCSRSEAPRGLADRRQGVFRTRRWTGLLPDIGRGRGLGSDGGSGAIPPLWHWNQVPVTQAQAALRGLFELWGLPERVRVDNGWPWGSSWVIQDKIGRELARHHACVINVDSTTSQPAKSADRSAANMPGKSTKPSPSSAKMPCRLSAIGLSFQTRPPACFAEEGELRSTRLPLPPRAEGAPWG